MIRYVGEAEVAPRGYGFAWHAVDRYGVYMAPVPLSLVLGGARAFWLVLVRGFWRSRALRMQSEAYARGYARGRRAAARDVRAALAAREREVQQIMDGFVASFRAERTDRGVSEKEVA